jgi:hypothetical protein
MLLWPVGRMEIRSMKPLPELPIEAKPQEYLRLAKMFRSAAQALPGYVNCGLNWPVYALVMVACELVLKAFCQQSLGSGLPLEREATGLKGWYDLALRTGLTANDHIAANIDILAEIHERSYACDTISQGTFIPDVSIISDQVVDWLIATVSALIYLH